MLSVTQQTRQVSLREQPDAMVQSGTFTTDNNNQLCTDVSVTQMTVSPETIAGNLEIGLSNTVRDDDKNEEVKT